MHSLDIQMYLNEAAPVSHIMTHTTCTNYITQRHYEQGTERMPSSTVYRKTLPAKLSVAREP